MLDDLLFRLTELERKLTNLVRAGKVAEADYAAARVRVQAGAIITGWLPWLTTRAGGDRTWWAPEVGEQVLMIAPAGELAQAWVLPAGYSDAATAPANSPDITRWVWADGSAVTFDRALGTLSVNVTGDVAVIAGGDASLETGGAVSMTAGGPVSIEAPSISMAGTATGASLTGNFALTGTLSVDGSITATGSIIDAGGNTPNHSH